MALAEGAEGMGPGPDRLRQVGVRPAERSHGVAAEHGYLPRPGLRWFFDAVESTPVSTIVAPAGSGKTAAAAAWSEDARATGAEVHWTPVDDVDRLAARLQPAAGPPSVVVVDDAHRLPAAGVDLLRRHLTESPDSVRILLLARHHLGFVPASLALDRRAQNLGAADLRMPPNEAEALVLQRHPEIDDGDLERVVDQGDGWAAALVLASNTLRASGNSDPLARDARVALTAVTRATIDYLADEVFADFPAALQQVLLATCHEPVVTAESAIVMSGIPSARSLLEQAAEDGMLITRTDGSADHRPGWRYHPLLVELLRQRTAPGGPHWPLLTHAHERAARHYRRLGNGALALHHAGLAEDINLQLLVLREFTPQLLATGHAGLVAAALRRVPDGVRDNLPALSALEAQVLRSLRRYDAAKAAADRALAQRPPRGDRHPDRELQADLAILEVWQARRGWRPATAAVSHAADTLGCQHHAGDRTATHDTSGISPLRSAWLMLDLAGLQLWADDLDLADVHAHAAGAYAQEVELPRLTCAVLALRASLELATSAYQSASGSASACLAVHEQAMLAPDATRSRAFLVRAWSRFQALDLDGAEQDLAASAAGPREPLDPFDVVYGRLLEANLLMARGAAGAARRLLDARGAMPTPLPSYVDRMWRLARLHVAGRLADIGAVDAEANGLRAAGFRGDATLVRALELGLGGSERAAIHSLEALLVEPDLYPVTAASAVVGRVALLHRLGTAAEMHRAQELVPDMLSRLAPQRLVWVLAMGLLLSPDFTDLLTTEVTRPDGHPFAHEALAALDSYQSHQPEVSIRQGQGPLRRREADVAWPAGLTDREVDVLRELALGGTNAAIAHALFVSDNTVKTHLASIYRKLDVDSRAGALTAARELHLL